ncbi:uncharacterized protein METZ01_LOCUS85570 [marine metagenome]|uniref:Uncharacterized protein n=1 Tax=marine metagenome TaxID=408172 RepID=A0A381UX61_9ZZZZ
MRSYGSALIMTNKPTHRFSMTDGLILKDL